MIFFGVFFRPLPSVNVESEKVRVWELSSQIRKLLNTYPQKAAHTLLLCPEFTVFYVLHTSWTRESHSLSGWRPGLRDPMV